MALYRCNKCGYVMDGDHDGPGVLDIRDPVATAVVCPSCQVDIEEDIEAAHELMRAEDRARDFAKEVERQAKKYGSVSNLTIVRGW